MLFQPLGRGASELAFVGYYDDEGLHVEKMCMIRSVSLDVFRRIFTGFSHIFEVRTNSVSQWLGRGGEGGRVR